MFSIGKYIPNRFSNLKIDGEIASLDEAYKLCQETRKKIEVVWQAQLGRDVITHKATLVPSGTMPVSNVMIGVDAMGQLEHIETNPITMVFTKPHMTLYENNYDVISAYYDR